MVSCDLYFPIVLALLVCTYIQNQTNPSQEGRVVEVERQLMKAVPDTKMLEKQTACMEEQFTVYDKMVIVSCFVSLLSTYCYRTIGLSPTSSFITC